jgi:hypothetical protein
MKIPYNYSMYGTDIAHYVRHWFIFLSINKFTAVDCNVEIYLKENESVSLNWTDEAEGRG